jgi:Flp pilus assembly pilin Flp
MTDRRAPHPRPADLGQGLVEYGLILALSALFAVVLLVFFGPTLSAVLEVIGEAIEQAS